MMYSLKDVIDRSVIDRRIEVADRLCDDLGKDYSGTLHYEIRPSHKGDDYIITDGAATFTVLEWHDMLEVYVRDSSRDALLRGHVIDVLDSYTDLLEKMELE